MEVDYYLQDKQGVISFISNIADKSCGILRRAQGCVILDRDGFTAKKQTHLSDICEVVPTKKVDSAAHWKLGYSDLHLSLRNM
ncbi:hypothetical protein MKW98_026001 [Papaver atlanticum]|uniref:Uncharacterized protein n=1 Tax=Papaver atlanticum TaxID=357466 RepID=A0AAD4RXW6_9MAGN|nr:hypothetical protein MKW98_026001 [Papaver atlanticum]